MNPGVFKKDGLKHLDRVIDLVSSAQAARGLTRSAQSTTFTPSSICTLHPEVKISIGMLTLETTKLSVRAHSDHTLTDSKSGSTRTSKTAPSRSGNTLQRCVLMPVASLNEADGT
jgi:hypothetical protein